ncbi:MAG: hypothetical protein ACOYMA_12220 [Bacteroidia bacterium]
MNLVIKTVALAFFIFVFFNNVNAQHKDTSNNVKYLRDSTTQVVITLKDQSTIKGIIITMNLEEISLKTDFAGIITIKQNNIISIVNSMYFEPQKQQYPTPNIYNPNNPNDLNIVKFGGSTNYYNRPFTPFTNNNRYNFSNNYIGLKKNELIYNNIWVLYNSLDYGINDNLAIGGGVLFLGFGGFINVLGRGQIHINENIKIGASYNYFMLFNSTSSRSSSQDNNLGLLSGGITLTGKKGNISVSIANGYYNNNLGQNASEAIAGFSFSGCLDINEKTSLVSDNFWVLSKINPRSYSLGMRIKGRSGSFDFGLMSYSYDEDYNSYYSGSSSVTTRTYPIPYLALTQKIN